MTRLYDDPANFMDDMLAGFLDVHQGAVVGVPGGVVRATETPKGKVAVVVGGGSGHYPAFCGVVGPGFADGAVVGNIFTSPSADDAYSVGKAASGGGGVLFSTGNYAGDVMNFNQAKQRLCDEGIDTRTVYVTDDIASASRDEMAKRRGIAGDFVVFKVAGAAADRGYDLDGVERIARYANDRTRTLGVAFAGCTMPGADSPLFTVPEGMMGVGLGIHGEPGVSEDAMPRAAELARRLVDGVLEELPDAGVRVGAILNGLGSTKYEELFVVWRTVSALLADRGFTVVEPEVGELVTSLDMAGCSLTLVVLDEELERLWSAPAHTPAYRKGVTTGQQVGTARRLPPGDAATSARAVDTPAASSASRDCARRTFAALEAMSAAVQEVEEELGRIDAVAGDGDHGRGMVKGLGAAVHAARPIRDEGGVQSLLKAAGNAWAAKAGGTSGALWGAALSAVGDRLGDQSEEIVPSDVVESLRAGLAALQRLGEAKVGDKTMLDSAVPFIDALDRGVKAGKPLSVSWVESAQTAEKAAQGTAGLRPRVGRARPLAERSIGTPDAGAVSFALCATAIGKVLSNAN